MSYIDAARVGNKIVVSERDKNGQRHVRALDPLLFCYVDDPDGENPRTSIYGDPVRRVDFQYRSEMINFVERAEVLGTQLYESDVRLEYKLLEDRYRDAPIPELNVAIIDIEVDTRSKYGWARPTNPYAIVNAVTVCQMWRNETFTLLVRPDTLTMEEAMQKVEHLPDTFVLETEEELLELFLDLIKDADVTTGWNSSFYDMPYLVNRIRIALGKESLTQVLAEPNSYAGSSLGPLSQLCLFDKPRYKEVDRWGSTEPTYTFPGRPHLDYLELYRKFTYEERFSYTLDAILQLEVDQTKIPYEGTLEQLYREDFGLFAEYNRQDVEGLVAVDKKLGFIELANEMVHMACVLLPDSLGSVTIIEQAILVELHKTRNQVVPDKNVPDFTVPVAGAFVVEPRGGMEGWLASFDVNSLYPSVIRMLNISPETVMGQFDITKTNRRLKELIDSGVAKNRQDAWHHFTGVDEYHELFEDDEAELLFRYEGGGKDVKKAVEWRRALQEAGCSVSANGTVFSQAEQGIIPYCLEKWYDERVQYKAMSKKAGREGDTTKEAYWDRIQYVRKIFLNSTYGAFLNRYFRFYDERFGQSVTLSGRVITKHMIKEANKQLCGTYDFGDAVIYGDTDSAYVRLDKWVSENPGATLDDIVEYADAVGEKVNASFPPKMNEFFLVSENMGSVIQAGREVVAERGLFKNAKKRYALNVADLEGKRDLKGTKKLKIMGMDTQRTDTPKFVQVFLTECLRRGLIEGHGPDQILAYAEEFRDEFWKRDPWTNGTPCRVSNLKVATEDFNNYFALLERGAMVEKPDYHYSVLACYNTNRLIKLNDERVMDEIRDGDKVQVLRVRQDDLQRNPLRIDKIALNVSASANQIPDWFKQLPFDTKKHEEKLIAKKLENIFGILGWDLKPREVDVNVGCVYGEI